MTTTATQETTETKPQRVPPTWHAMLAEATDVLLQSPLGAEEIEGLTIWRGLGEAKVRVSLSWPVFSRLFAGETVKRDRTEYSIKRVGVAFSCWQIQPGPAATDVTLPELNEGGE